MSAHVLCVTSGSGLPVFSRVKGNAENLAFSIIGSINGTHMFAKSQKVDLISTETDDYIVLWKEFYDSLMLIGISTGCTTTVLDKLLQSVFNVVVLVVGIDEVKSQKNIERLKRELRVFHPLIDRLIDSLNCGDASSRHSSDLIGLVETVLCTENHLIQVVLDSFTECADSMYSCVLIHGKIAAATESWWTLHPEEIKLLSLLAITENTGASKDVPIFLPYKSPTAAFRFVCCTLVPNVLVCCLCGPTPSLQEIEDSAGQCFKNTLEILNAAVQCHPRNFPQSFELDGGILGVLLINTQAGKYMISKSPQQNTAKRIASSSHRLDILRTFYYETVLTHFSQDDNKEVKTTACVGTETYWCSEYHKCHALKVDHNIICVLYNATVPTQAIKLITQKTLKTLIQDKQVCW